MSRFPITVALAASLVVMFGIQLSLGALGRDEVLLGLGAIPASGGVGAGYWSLVAYAWLHAGYGHLLANVGLLWWVGRIVERRLRSAAMLGIYLACVLAGGLLIAWNAANHPKAGVSLGASAGVSGLLTAALVLLYRPATSGFGQARWLRGALWGILLLGIGLSLLPGVSLVGHVGGLVLGAVLGAVVPVRPPDESVGTPIAG